MATISRRNFLKTAGLGFVGTAALGVSQLAAPVAAVAEDGSGSATTYDSDYCYNEGYESCVNIVAEGAVLLRNQDNLLPLAEGSKVTLLGAMSYNYVLGGTGSAGGADDENTVMMSDATPEMPASPGWPIQNMPSTLYSSDSANPSSMAAAEFTSTIVCL